MKWHQGTIVGAVSEAKDKQLIFVVFIYGNDEPSKALEECLNEEAISQILDSKCVALKLEANSEGAKQFSQIYPVVVLPSVFFIGGNGIPLEVIGGNVERNPLLEKINNILELHNQQTSNSAKNDASQQKPTEASSATKSSQPSTSNSAMEKSATDDDNLQTSKTNEEDLNERIKRARILVAERQEAKAKEESEKEKQKEIERRNLGKNLQEFKQRQKEMEHKKLADEIVRERAEEKEAREKIRQQIARDRAERASKYDQEKSAEEARKQEALQAQREKANLEAANRSNTARLQLKLPEGNSVVHQFSADSKLHEVYNFIKETVKPPFPSFKLCLIFPRRDFTQLEFSQTLRDLQLVPNASLLILPDGNKSIIQAPPSGFFNSFIWAILSPIMAMWRFFYNLVFGAPNQPPPPRQPSNTTAQPSTSAGSNSASDSGRPELKRPRLSPQETSFTRREGNIHRLANDSDDEDENNTWNGNSTQQM